MHSSVPFSIKVTAKLMMKSLSQPAFGLDLGPATAQIHQSYVKGVDHGATCSSVSRT
jgi:hypothetical protein